MAKTNLLSASERAAIALKIRAMVSRYTLTYGWLIRQLSDEGLITDKFELSATLAGTRTGPKADQILWCSLGVLTEYRRKMQV